MGIGIKLQSIIIIYFFSLLFVIRLRSNPNNSSSADCLQPADGPPAPSDHRLGSSTYSALSIFLHEASSSCTAAAASHPALAPFVGTWRVISGSALSARSPAGGVSAGKAVSPGAAQLVHFLYSWALPSPSRQERPKRARRGTAHVLPGPRKQVLGGKVTKPGAVTGRRCGDGREPFSPSHLRQRRAGFISLTAEAYCLKWC